MTEQSRWGPLLLIAGGGGALLLLFRSQQAEASEGTTSAAPTSLVDQVVAGLAQVFRPQAAPVVSTPVVRQGAAVQSGDGGFQAALKIGGTAITVGGAAAKAIAPSLFPLTTVPAVLAETTAPAAATALTVQQVIGESALAEVSAPLFLEAANPAVSGAAGALAGAATILGPVAAGVGAVFALRALIESFGDPGPSGAQLLAEFEALYRREPAVAARHFAALRDWIRGPGSETGNIGQLVYWPGPEETILGGQHLAAINPTVALSVLPRVGYPEATALLAEFNYQGVLLDATRETGR